MKLLLLIIALLLFPGVGIANNNFVAMDAGNVLIFEFDVVSTQTISGAFRTSSASDAITVYWGDGTKNTYSGTSDQAYSKDYGSVGNRTVHIYAASGSVLTRFTMTQSGANVSFALSDLPSGVTYFVCRGSNTVSGSLSDLPSGVTYFVCFGSNTVSGSLSDLPSGVTYFYCLGSNTISGSLSDLPSGVTYFDCRGSNTISDYVAHPWASNMQRVYLAPAAGSGLSGAEVDQALIDLDSAGGTWAGDKVVWLEGNNSARTSASDAAVASLTGKGVTVTTN